MFGANKSRFATFGVISRTPGVMIDALWSIIDNNLQGVFPLQNLLRFEFRNHDGQLQVVFTEKGLDAELAVDLDYKYLDNLPASVYAYDDGNVQTILLEDELE